MGYAGKDIIEQLPQLVTGAILKGLIMVKCESYKVSKAYKVILRRLLTKLIILFYKIYLDLIPGIVIYNGDRHAVHFLNNATQINKVKMMVKKSFLP